MTASCEVCGVVIAVPANADPPGPTAIPNDTKKLFGALPRGFVSDQCDSVDLVGSQLAAILCQVDREPNGP